MKKEYFGIIYFIAFFILMIFYPYIINNRFNIFFSIPYSFIVILFLIFFVFMIKVTLDLDYKVGKNLTGDFKRNIVTLIFIFLLYLIASELSSAFYKFNYYAFNYLTEEEIAFFIPMFLFLLLSSRLTKTLGKLDETVKSIHDIISETFIVIVILIVLAPVPSSAGPFNFPLNSTNSTTYVQPSIFGIYSIFYSFVFLLLDFFLYRAIEKNKNTFRLLINGLKKIKKEMSL